MEEYFYKCSICYDRGLDFCLPVITSIIIIKECKDQFCRECFEIYVNCLVTNSWGLVMLKVKCPVCSIIIPKETWSQVLQLLLKSACRFKSL